jgi:hypothetical protein
VEHYIFILQRGFQVKNIGQRVGQQPHLLSRTWSFCSRYFTYTEPKLKLQ